MSASLFASNVRTASIRTRMAKILASRAQQGRSKSTGARLRAAIVLLEPTHQAASRGALPVLTHTSAWKRPRDVHGVQRARYPREDQILRISARTAPLGRP